MRACLIERVPGEATFAGAVLLDAAFLSLVNKRIARRAAESSLTDTEAEELRRFALDLFRNGIKDTFDGESKTWLDAPECHGRRKKRLQPLDFTKYVV